MKLESIIHLGAIAGFALLMSCSKIKDAEQTIADLNKEEAAQTSDECQSYKDKYKQSGDSAWLELYKNNCEEAFIAANTPEGLSADCEKQYADLIQITDSIVMSLRGVCDSTNLKTEQTCIDAKKSVESKAKAFQEKCGVDKFYYPTPDEAAPPTTTVNGECAWKVWIPMETRLPEQDSTAMLKCDDKATTCSKVFFGDTARLVEIHQSIEGDTVYLPCIQEVNNQFAPCDFNKDRTIDPIESSKCQEGNGTVNPCDWNKDGILDEFEKSQCASKSDSGYVNPGLYDPCDWNYDGKVDSMEAEKCRNAYSCNETQTPYWDAVSQKQICINKEDIPVCTYPAYSLLVSGKVRCIDPCDKNQDGELQTIEITNCNVAQPCPAENRPYWNPETQSNVCIPIAEIPTCEVPTKPMFFSADSSLKCIDPCDRNMDGTIDQIENTSCFACPAGQVAMWDADNLKNVCKNPLECTLGTYPVVKDGQAYCANACDFNHDGTVDATEKSQCANTSTGTGTTTTPQGHLRSIGTPQRGTGSAGRS